MIRNLVARFTLILPLACGTSQPDDAALDSTRALAEARARAQELANSAQNYQPVRFVSAIEQVRPPKPVRTVKPEETIRDGVDSVSADPVMASAPGQGELESVTEGDSVAASDAPRVPSIIPRDAPTPDAVGPTAPAWRGHDPGPDMGESIGVVLRGGRIDPGHCPRHPRPPSQIPNRIPW
ncbi:MAG TPA: hypothetical protein VFZ73_00770 [Gemmatimonadaceae bacterium]